MHTIVTSSASFTIALLRSSSSSYVFTLLCRSQKREDRVPGYNKYCLSIHPPPFSIKGTERSTEEKESRARRNYFPRFVTCKYPRETGVLISRCRMKIRQRAKESTQREKERKRERRGNGEGGEGAGRHCKRQKEEENRGERIEKI